MVGARANLDLALEGVGLALFIEGHDDHGRAIAAAQFRLAQEFFFAFLHGNRIDDGLALHAFQARFDDRPFRRVDHDGHARNIGFRGDQVQKARHGGQRIEHRFIHVDVDHLRAVFHLLAGN